MYNPRTPAYPAYYGQGQGGPQHPPYPPQQQANPPAVPGYYGQAAYNTTGPYGKPPGPGGNVKPGPGPRQPVRVPADVTEVKFDRNDRRRNDDLADMYAIIRTIEQLEKAYVRDFVVADEYTNACKKLLAQYKTLHSALKDTIPSIQQFLHEYQVSCPAARNRIEVGVPATIEFGRQSSSSQTQHVAETVQHFITAMDALKLDLRAVDQLSPHLQDLMESMHKVDSLPPNFEGKEKILSWISKLNKMKASDELEDEQVRQLLFDLESSYNAFHRSLGSS
eukprot:GFYU01000096.1.p1 GENE.GFYU01000096.1~~GFYU01000096.1.p1  ORF type:complete len:279 (+),score=51.70 GFYU01000096.1:142-978(+)